MSDKLRIVIATTLALIEQFTSSLSLPAETSTQPSEQRSSLPLLSASASALKSQTTKLSLLTFTVPFTPSAISSILESLNDSILPSLTTAALLTTTKHFTKSFEDECHTLVRTILRELNALIEAVKLRSTSDPSKNVSDKEKAAITGLTGRLWEACDDAAGFANKGLVGFIVKKADQYKLLVQDAIKELEEWDPSLDEDEDAFGDLLSDDEEDAKENSNNSEPKAVAEVQEQKQRSLKILNRIPQCIHVIIKNRLQKGMPSAPSDLELRNLEKLQDRLQSISETVDEIVGALYESAVDQADEHSRNAKALTLDAVKLVLEPWSVGEEKKAEPTKEDKYMHRAKEWIEKS